MVVDLGATNSVYYYPSVDFLPGSEIGQKNAVVNNTAYKTTKLLMRKIMARGVMWTMGSAAGETQRNSETPSVDVEEPHVVTLTNNYYIGVFEVTQAQWKNITPTSSAAPQFTVEAAMRPMEKVSYNEIRNSSSKIANPAYNWPANPYGLSFLGLLRTKTGLDFDLPTEAQWEFAARAGHGSGFWGDGSVIENAETDVNLNNLARYSSNHGGSSTTSTLAPSTGGTAIVGSHEPNSWGLYDMHGNVCEACLDWYADNITMVNGNVNIKPSDSTKTYSGAAGSNRVRRGGSWYQPAQNCRPAHRTSAAPDAQSADAGLRVVCRAWLE
jgi:formylglycine-generating enzyme required for sulfatase activity